MVSRDSYAAKNAQVWQPDAEPLGGGGAVMGSCMKMGFHELKKTIELRFWLALRFSLAKNIPRT